MADAVTSTTGAGSAANSMSLMQNQELDRDAFLNLLITQLQHQDPMKPMEDREFIAQLAQFSSLEQMQQVNQQMDFLNANTMATTATSLIGRTISASDPSSDATFEGVVEAVVFVGGMPKLLVDGQSVDPSWITRVE